MLEGIAVELGVVIEVVGVGEEVLPGAEDVAGRDVGRRQPHLLRTGYLKGVLALRGQRFADFVAEVGIGIAVADNLHRILHAGRAMVGCENQFVAQLGYTAQESVQRRVLKPSGCQTPIC